jgi:uncharacterized protein (DUF433 family)
MKRITVDAEQCGGRPCIRGMRIRVIDVLDLLATGLTPQQVLEEIPDLEQEDIQACLQLKHEGRQQFGRPLEELRKKRRGGPS